MENKKYKILHVDDDKFLLDMYAVKFKKRGHEISTAQNGLEAFSILKGGVSPEVIILDVMMPQMDGLTLLKNIRDQRLAPDSKIIMLTNQGSTEDIEKAESLGASLYLIKAMAIPSEVVEEVELIMNK